MTIRLFQKAPDGGANSGVTGYFLIEAKSLFSIVLLRFGNGSREAFHSHAFNAVTLWLKGRIREHDVDGASREFSAGMWKWTPRNCFHKVEGLGTAWAISFRGPWANQWQENRRGELVTLTHGRKVI